VFDCLESIEIITFSKGKFEMYFTVLIWCSVIQIPRDSTQCREDDMML